MDDIFTKLKQTFLSGNILIKLIYINIGAFLLLRLSAVLFLLFNIHGVPFLEYLQMPSSPTLLLTRPWTLLTYMFTHYDFLHILFNMLWLYWFGGVFLQFFNERRFGGVYLLGGIAGALLFLSAYNIFPYFQAVSGRSFLMGASASVMAIVFAISFYRKEYEINLFLIGRVKLIWLAWFTLILDLLAITSANAGGHLAHIGGALFGIWYASRMKKGKDLTAPVNRMIDRLVNLTKENPLKRKPKMKVTYKRPETDYEYNARKNRENKDLDDILDRLKRSGYDSLSAEEKKRLFDASKK
ncbi:MAG: rhomboid family intramembrane serine protease [Tannerellaceae bacterium]|jgi:membrane associated rhomboid family serine protease|nr:rhomboid family intramembrane serine protease [Tannerellaceae bacterium]